MPLPEPGENESRDDWLERCMGNDTMNREYDDSEQRYAVCNDIWRRKAMNAKTFKLKNLKVDEKDGSFTAVFATLNVVDKDGDLTLPGAFGDQEVPIGAYGHGSWQGALPVGKGRVFEKEEEALVEGRFFLDTTLGSDTYKTIKEMGDLQEWSYALPEIDFEFREEDGRRIRVLKRITVGEVSPVLLAAGEGTRTLNIKQQKGGLRLLEHLELVNTDVEEVLQRLREVKDLREAKGRKISETTVERMNVLADILAETVKELKRMQEEKLDDPGLYREFLFFQKTITERRETC